MAPCSPAPRVTLLPHGGRWGHGRTSLGRHRRAWSRRRSGCRSLLGATPVHLQLSVRSVENPPAPTCASSGPNRRRDEPGPSRCVRLAGQGRAGQGRAAPQRQGAAVGAGEAPPARTQTVATAPSPSPAAAALAVVAGSDVTAEGRAGSGSGRWVARWQVQSAPAVVRQAPWVGGLPRGGGERRPGGARRLAQVSVRISPGSRVTSP